MPPTRQNAELKSPPLPYAGRSLAEHEGSEAGGAHPFRTSPVYYEPVPGGQPAPGTVTFCSLKS
jgi:hypothetical protein